MLVLQIRKLRLRESEELNQVYLVEKGGAGIVHATSMVPVFCPHFPCNRALAVSVHTKPRGK